MRQGASAYLRSHTRATLYYRLIDQLPDVYVVSHNPITIICTDTMLLVLYTLRQPLSSEQFEEIQFRCLISYHFVWFRFPWGATKQPVNTPAHIKKTYTLKFLGKITVFVYIIAPSRIRG